MEFPLTYRKLLFTCMEKRKIVSKYENVKIYLEHHFYFYLIFYRILPPQYAPSKLID